VTDSDVVINTPAYSRALADKLEARKTEVDEQIAAAAPSTHTHPAPNLSIQDQYVALVTTKGASNYRGDVTVKSGDGYVRLNPAGDGYITVEKAGVGLFSVYANATGSSKLPSGTYLRFRFTREPHGSKGQDHTGYLDVEIKAGHNVITAHNWQWTTEAGRKYSVWVDVRREGGPASGSVVISSRQFKMHNLVLGVGTGGGGGTDPEPDPDPILSLQDTIKGSNPWVYYELTSGATSADQTVPDASGNNRSLSVSSWITGFVPVQTNMEAPSRAGSVFNSNHGSSNPPKVGSLTGALDWGSLPGYTFSVFTTTSTTWAGPPFRFGNVAFVINGSVFAIHHDGVKVGDWGAGSGTFGPRLVHLAATYDKASQTLKVFVDGDLLTTVTGVAPPTGASSSHTALGGENYGATTYQQHMAFWTAAQSDTLIKQIAVAGARGDN
jgi:hypothetical protein